MKFLRTQALVFVLFSVITIGQAYPFAYVLQSVQAKECGCNRAGRECIHGCELKKHRGESHHSHANHHGSPSPTKQHGCHAKPPQPTSKTAWINPDCSQQKQQEILDFHGDPFLVDYPVKFLAALEFSMEVDFFQPSFPSWITSLDPPPPRG